MAVPIARYLVRFGHEPPPAPEPVIEPAEPLVKLSARELAEQIDAAHARGAEEARIATTTAVAEVLDAERQQAEARMIAERIEWTTTQADRLAQDIARAFQSLETTLAASLAQVVKPLLSEAVRNRILSELAETLAQLLSDDNHPVIRVSGPSDLLEKLRQAVSTPRAIDYVAAEAAEVTITADGTLIRSQLQAWLAPFHSVDD
jgi:flagellar biosynthesis/type III secretory pathway protein FliH